MPQFSKTPSIVLDEKNRVEKKGPGARSTFSHQLVLIPLSNVPDGLSLLKAYSLRPGAGHRSFMGDQIQDIVPHFFMITKTVNPMPFPPSFVRRWAFTLAGPSRTARVPPQNKHHGRCSHTRLSGRLLGESCGVQLPRTDLGRQQRSLGRLVVHTPAKYTQPGRRRKS
jgi:hypothetical protein